MTPPIIHLIARKYHLTVSDITGPSRSKGDLMQARHLAANALYEHGGYRICEIASILNKDPTTIRYALQRGGNL